MNRLISIQFHIGAAKNYQDDNENPDWKYLDTAATCEEALAKFHSVRSYPIVMLECVSIYEDSDRKKTMLKSNLLDGEEYVQNEKGHFVKRGA